jgi:hypothetical protein
MPENQQRATEVIDSLSVNIVTTSFSVVMASREKAYSAVLAAITETDRSALNRVVAIFDDMSSAGVKSISPEGASDLVRSLLARGTMPKKSGIGADHKKIPRSSGSTTVG